MVTSVSPSRSIQLAVWSILLFVILANCNEFEGVPYVRSLKTINSCPLVYTGTDWKGGDIGSFTSGLRSASACCTYCNTHHGARVRAYIYRRDFDHCYCKDRVNPPSNCPNCQGRNYYEQKPPRSCKYRYNYDNYGTDLPGMPIEGVTQAGECCKHCQNYGSECVAWLWRRDFNRCYLKKTILPLTRCPQCVYGER